LVLLDKKRRGRESFSLHWVAGQPKGKNRKGEGVKALVWRNSCPCGGDEVVSRGRFIGEKTGIKKKRLGGGGARPGFE